MIKTKGDNIKKAYYLALTTLSFLMTGCVSINSEKVNSFELRTMTFNIRNGEAMDGENHWKFRKTFVCDVIRDYSPDVLGIQEAYRFQLDEFNTCLPEYGEIGIGRDGETSGEYSSILYLKKRFNIGESGTFWLSDTPETPSISWGNNHRRICTWTHLIDKKSRGSFYIYNTHLDHQSQQAREMSVQLIIKHINARKTPDPFILMGDFNASEANSTITYLKGLEKLINKTPIPLVDSFRVLYPEEKIVATGSWFTGNLDGPKIDYIFITPDTDTIDAAIVRTNRNGRYPSDHYPVTAQLRLRHSHTVNKHNSKTETTNTGNVKKSVSGE